MDYGVFTGFWGLALLLLLIVTALLWFFIPFAVFGIKPILQDIRLELRRANELTERQLAPSHPHPATPPQVAPPEDHGTGTLGTIRAAIKQANKG